MAARIDDLAERYGRTPSEILQASPGELAVDAICRRAGGAATWERATELGMVVPGIIAGRA